MPAGKKMSLKGYGYSHPDEMTLERERPPFRIKSPTDGFIQTGNKPLTGGLNNPIIQASRQLLPAALLAGMLMEIGLIAGGVTAYWVAGKRQAVKAS
jgi:hypothetical protein